MPELPSITVVTPVLNGVATLPEALASVREQDYPRVDHVVVDGGSTDGTVELLERTESIRFVSEPDRGLSDALNKGIGMATGDVIGWLNADDLYNPGALRRVGEALAEHPEAEWATGYCRIVDGSGREIRGPVTRYKNALLRRYSLPLYLTHNFVSTPSTFIRRSAYDAVGLYPLEYRASMDYDVHLRLARRGDPVVLEHELAAFRMQEGTVSMSGFENQFREHALQGRIHGEGHPVAVAANQAISRAIVLVYRAMRALRRSA